MDKRKEKEIWLLNIILKTACKDEISCNGLYTREKKVPESRTPQGISSFPERMHLKFLVNPAE